MNTTALHDTAEGMTYAIRDRLVKERKKLGVSQRSLARAVGVSVVHMNRLEKGNAFPSYAVLYEWCFAMGYEAKVVLMKHQYGVRAEGY